MTAEKHETKFQAVKRHGKAGTVVLLLGSIPAIFGAWKSYEQSKREADTGYQIVVAETKRQGEAIVAIQKNDDVTQKNMAEDRRATKAEIEELRRMIVQVLLARASYGRGGAEGSPAPVVAAPPPPPPPMPVLRPIGQYKSLELPATLDMAQTPSNVPAPLRQKKE